MTTKQMQVVERLLREGLYYKEIAEIAGVSISSVSSCGKKKGITPAHKQGRPKKTYTVYLKKDSRYIVEGTAEKCAEMMGMKMSTFWSTKTRTEQGIYNKYEFYEVVE